MGRIFKWFSSFNLLGYFSTAESRELVEHGIFPPSFSHPYGLFLLCLFWFLVSFEFYMCMTEILRGLYWEQQLANFAIKVCLHFFGQG